MRACVSSFCRSREMVPDIEMFERMSYGRGFVRFDKRKVNIDLEQIGVDLSDRRLIMSVGIYITG